MDNPFVLPPVREIFIQWFAKMQRIYWAFSSIAKKWRWRRPKIQIHTDLYMNTLDQIHPHTFHLMQLNNVYLFTLSNLTNIILNAITHSDHFYHNPLPIKNPYNNVGLSKPDLYNIYFRIRSVYIKVPMFIQRFFECEFNIYRFKLECESELREHAITEYIKSADPIELYGDIETMITEYDKNKYLRISPRFPYNLVVQAFKPFLHTYYVSLYSFDKSHRDYAKVKLHTELTRFIYANTMFGQNTGKFMRSQTNPFVETDTIEYHRKWVHPKVVPSGTKNYMNNHSFNDEVFERYIVHGDVDMVYMHTSVEPTTSAQLFTMPGIRETIREPITRETITRAPETITRTTEEDSEEESSQQDDDADDEDTVADHNITVIAAEEEEDTLSEVSDYLEEAEEEDYDW
jgi:hypothetical protein